MEKRVEKIKLLKDVPGAKAGDEINVFETGVMNGEGVQLRGANIGGKFYWYSELPKYPDFFELS